MRLHFIFILILAWMFSARAQNHEIRTIQRDHASAVPHPVILDMVSAINKDSLAEHMRGLESFGTRFMYAENRREVAAWIAHKFQSYGITNVVLDSFKMVGDILPEDSVWQYNVVATLQGTSAAGEIYILGAHHDDYSDGNLYQIAPGADDNASGCAVELEIARVFMEKGFRPASTIRFITFAAEELVGYKNYSGSIYCADKVHSRQEDLRLMINNDMVANTTGSGMEMFATDMPEGRNSWAGELTALSVALYSTLEMISGVYPTSDATTFYNLGYCVAGFEQFGMTWTYHTVHDSVVHCNMDICLEAAKATCAVLLNEQMTPVPQELSARGTPNSIVLSWKQTQNENVDGYGIYRSESPDSGYVLIERTYQNASVYEDSTASGGKVFYYRVTSFDPDGYESVFSVKASGAIAPMDKELLVVKDSKGGYNNPADSTVIAFYHDIFRNLGYDFCDASETDSLNLPVLGKYQKIVWLSNTYSTQTNSSFVRHREEITSYVKSGGSLFLSAFQPSFLIAGNALTGKTFDPADPIVQYFKIQKVERKPSAALNGAYPAVDEDYDSLWVDPQKAPDTPVGHLLNVECIYPVTDATLIYRFNSSFDTTVNQGIMKGKPVGLEYLGDDFKVIILSVPLFYLDSTDARTLLELIINEKFKTPTGVKDNDRDNGNNARLRIYPNPCSDLITISFTSGSDTRGILEITDITGKNILTLPARRVHPGINFILQPVNTLNSGIYQVQLRTYNKVYNAKMVIQQ